MEKKPSKKLEHKVEKPKLISNPVKNRNYKKDCTSSDKLHNKLPKSYQKNKNKHVRRLSNSSSSYYNVTQMKFSLDVKTLFEKEDKTINNDEVNEISFEQALRVDKRDCIQMFFSVFAYKVQILNLIFYLNPLSSFYIIFLVYLLDVFLDIVMNCLLYTDDVVSEKYHNEGELSYITTLSLSIISTAIASFVSAVLENLTNYISILQEILYNSKNEQKCHINMKRFFKYLYKRITCFIFVDIILISALSYYLIIFCSIYKNSLKSTLLVLIG